METREPSQNHDIHHYSYPSQCLVTCYHLRTLSFRIRGCHCDGAWYGKLRNMSSSEYEVVELSVASWGTCQTVNTRLWSLVWQVEECVKQWIWSYRAWYGKLRNVSSNETKRGSRAEFIGTIAENSLLHQLCYWELYFRRGCPVVSRESGFG